VPLFFIAPFIAETTTIMRAYRSQHAGRLKSAPTFGNRQHNRKNNIVAVGSATYRAKVKCANPRPPHDKGEIDFFASFCIMTKRRTLIDVKENRFLNLLDKKTSVC
jgi:hypothetical protein